MRTHGERPVPLPIVTLEAVTRRFGQVRAIAGLSLEIRSTFAAARLCGHGRERRGRRHRQHGREARP